MNKFKEIFTGLERAHGYTKIIQSNGVGEKVKGQSFVKREQVTENHWKEHLQGTNSLGIIPINDDNKCRWGCIDIDSYAGFDHKKLIQKIKSLKLPLVVFRSKSGGAHVFLFSNDYVEAKTMRDKLTQIKAVLGYSGSEIFPKQTELKSKDDTGNFLNLPYFNGDDTTRYAFKDDGTAANLEEFYGIYNNKKQLHVGSIKVQRPQSEFSDGPPCIELMAINKIPENGGRNNAMFHFGVYAKKKWPAEWKTKLTMFNADATTVPLTENELDIVKRQHEKKIGVINVMMFQCVIYVIRNYVEVVNME